MNCEERSVKSTKNPNKIMSGKRTLTGDAGGSGDQPPAAKKSMTQFEPVRLGSVSTLEEMDIKVLKFQNKKLAERLDQRLRAEGELRLRIEQLEKRQMQDDAVLCIVNRYWNQLNEDVRVLLQRFDAETADESESRNENEATTSFLMQLSTWDKQELEEKLAQRVQVSQRAVAKILQAFDRLVQRNEKITMALKGENSDSEDNTSLDDAVKEANCALQNENRNLHSLVTSLHEKHHVISLQLAELQEQVTAMETGNAELKNRVEDLEYDVDKTRRREEKLDRHLSEALLKLKAFEARAETIAVGSNSDSDGKNHPHAAPVAFSSVTAPPPGVAQRKLEELQRDLEEEKELSTNRMMELEKLHQEHKGALKEVEKLKMDIQQLPESVIVETTEYKCLQSQFSVLYNESMQLKTQLEESRNFLQASKNAHLRQIEQMESEELMVQKKLRNEVIQLEDSLSQVRKEYEMLRIEFEQNLAANEQTGPINREMRHLITSLQNHNQQLKIEVSRFKRKLKDANGEVIKLKSEHSVSHSSSSGEANAKEEPSSSTSFHGHHGSGPSSSKGGDDSLFKRERDEEAEEEREREKGKSDADIIRDLKTQLKKSQEAQREMKLLLDMYKGVAKEQRDKVQLMAAEKKARSDVDELRQQLKRVQESERKERRKLADEDAVRKIKQLEDVIQQLQRSVAAQKQLLLASRSECLQEEEALLNEMEVTGQAFEDMQEQNIRLIQQLREKDDANFKLMSERIKSNQIHKLLREEKDVLGEQVSTLHTQVEAQNAVVRRLEEKERILQNNLSTVEKELSLRQQAMEMHKRKAIESTQSAADLKLHLEKYHSQLKEAQLAVADKTCSLEHESFKIKRLQEEIAGLRKKIERAKKFELASTADEVLMEEIREYKEQLTCPSCKVKRKDAVLTKCFHVFCFDCLKTRYETRQRKCPKCNAAFGANDFHRLYLS